MGIFWSTPEVSGTATPESEVQEPEVSFEPYTYEECPLSHPDRQVRLLLFDENLTSAREFADSFVQCRLVVHVLHHHVQDDPEPSQFTAVSYAWGSKSDDNCVLVDGKRLSVSDNLYAFLHYASRHPILKSKRFWIDQVCMNQNDKAEIATQIPQMVDIYQDGEVIVWLGDTTTQNQESLKNLRTSLAQKKVLDEREQEQLYEALACCSYWKRIWIIQELLLGRYVTVTWGSVSMDWVDLCKFLWQYHAAASERVSGHFTTDSRLEKLSSFWQMVDSESKLNFCWARALDLSEGAQSSLAEDKIYGLLGLVDESCRIKVAYKEKTLGEIFLEIMQKQGEMRNAESLREFQSLADRWADHLGVQRQDVSRFYQKKRRPRRANATGAPTEIMSSRGWPTSLISRDVLRITATKAQKTVARGLFRMKKTLKKVKPSRR